MSKQISQAKKRFDRAGTFADSLVRYIRERRSSDAPSVYTAAQVDRRTYSSIVSNPFRPVSKRTAILFAVALRLAPDEAEGLLKSAGYAFSPAIPEDAILSECIANGEYDLVRINCRLDDLGLRTL